MAPTNGGGMEIKGKPRKKHRGRVHALVRALASVLVATSALAFADVAAALTGATRNWPNSPVRHTLSESVAASTPSFAANLRGGAAVAGNTVETCPGNSAAARRRRRGVRAESCLNANNNDQNMVYVNVDPAGGRFNSSTATLTVPAGARVVKAFLYWAGDLSEGVNRPTNPPSYAAPGGNSPSSNPLYTTVLMRTGSSAYATID